MYSCPSGFARYNGVCVPNRFVQAKPGQFCNPLTECVGGSMCLGGICRCLPGLIPSGGVCVLPPFGIHWRFLDRLPSDRLLLTEPRLYSPPSNGRLNVLFCNTKASDSRISSGRIFICVFATLSTSGLTGAKSMLLVINVPSSVIKGLLTTEKS
ncbi:hypothetical protein T07_11858 [Trichinella nelsoni]|uniref:EB domain-containing protein n=1 Tax=Trichinella nelsoni TaxID=6336 RepID=A0A0V0SNE1_9BILA|nr:hypothetical protein T07_11858 [Trichinella nelsoni]